VSLHDHIFKKIQDKANVNPEDIHAIADSVKHANFSDEETVRNLVKQLSSVANKPISESKEDKIVQAIINNQFPSSLDSLNKDFD